MAVGRELFNVGILDEIDTTRFVLACKRGDIHLVETLLIKGLSLDIINDGLIWASIKGHSNVVELLIDNGANVNSRDNNGHTALLYACKKGL